MVKAELDAFEKLLSEQGYKKYTSCLSSSESWGWFKTCKEKDGDYLIEYRVWDYTPYPQVPKESEYGIDVLIMMSGEGRIDVNLSHIRDLKIVEEVAHDFYRLCRRKKLLDIYEK